MSVEIVKSKTGVRVSLDLNKLTLHCRRLCSIEPQLHITDQEILELVKNSINSIVNGISTNQINKKLAENASKMFNHIPDMYKLGGRLIVNILHNNTNPKFSQSYGTTCVSQKFLEFITENANELDQLIISEYDHQYDYSAMLTLIRSYLLKCTTRKDECFNFTGDMSNKNLATVETPQYMNLRIAVFTHMFTTNPLPAIAEMYTALATRKYMHATPTMFNAGTVYAQTASCFLLDMDDTLVKKQGSIFGTIENIGAISKRAGGIGLNITKIRGVGAQIKTTQGTSNGIEPLLRVLDSTLRYVNQGGRRPGSCAVYIEPWHTDFVKYLDCFSKTPESGHPFHNLFAAVWCPDLFIKRCMSNQKWTFFSPDTTPELANTWGEEFERYYTKYEERGVGTGQMPASELMTLICSYQIKTGTPYFLFKDRANYYSNQSRIDCISADTGKPAFVESNGIVCSNLCAEIIERAETAEYAVCNLASLIMSSYVIVPDEKSRMDYILGITPGGALPYIDWVGVARSTRSLVRNINNLINHCHYPIDECRDSNMHWRPIGIGIQGLADALARMGLCFDSENTVDFIAKLMEWIYYNAVCESCRIAEETGNSIEQHESQIPSAFGYFKWELAYMGMKQYHAQSENFGIPTSLLHRANDGVPESSRYNVYNCADNVCDWDELRERVKLYGRANSLVVALMPTAGTSIVSGASECFEPISGISVVRKTMNGTFNIINSNVVKDLKYLNVDTPGLYKKIIGSDDAFTQNKDIPAGLRNLYRPVSMYSQKVLCELHNVMSIYVDQSMSCNRYMDGNLSKLTSLHITNYLYGGLITSSYYTRTVASAKANNPLQNRQSEGCSVCE